MNQLQIIEHEGIRVLTTQQLSEVYETSTENIKQNFKRNKERFNEGRDYYLLKGEQLKEFLQVTNSHLQNQSKIRSMYLWTEHRIYIYGPNVEQIVIVRFWILIKRGSSLMY